MDPYSDGIRNDDELIYELKPGMKRCAHRMRYTGNQCQLADGHILRHAWEPAALEQIAAIETQSDAYRYKGDTEC